MRDMVEGIVLTVLSLIAIWGAWQVPAAGPGDTWAGIVPFGAAVALLVLSSLVLLGGLQAMLRGEGAIPFGNTGTLDILILFAIALLYQQSFRWFGYILPTAIVAPVVLYIFGVRNPIGLVLSAVICPLVFHVLFFELLGVFPPYGEVFDLGDWLWG